jgi:UDP-2-acetamido-2,6-beta-L-arabino-hexul-4-ose reductase
VLRVLVTGSSGFIGKNLLLHLAERPDVHVQSFTHSADPAALRALVADADFIFHLAGVNRPLDPAEFNSGNASLTRQVTEAVARVAIKSGRRIPVVYTSSIQAELPNPYGQSKREAERAIFALARQHEVPVHVFRLPNVMGKWSRPNYNSVVATFCHNIARDLPIQIHDPAAPLTLVYVDDLVGAFLEILNGERIVPSPGEFSRVATQYRTTVGAIAEQLHGFRKSRSTLMTDNVGVGLTRALYATYVSYLPIESFAFEVPKHSDERGDFVEMLKTPEAGQFSFLTAHSGVTRGGHYHHSKVEKFLVIRGQARFRFRHMHTGEKHEILVSGSRVTIVETIPGWTHDITNVGCEELIVMLWANEVYIKNKPDTYVCKI